MLLKIKKIKRAFIIYWILLAYIIAALVWWFIALSRQNAQMSRFKINDLQKVDAQYSFKLAKIKKEKNIKTAQYLGEGGTFLLLIIAGAIFVFRSVRRELRVSADQQNLMMAITHELKTPIAITKLNLETLQRRKLDEGQQEKLLLNTIREADRLDSLCNNLLLSSQIDAGGYRLTAEEINFSSIVKQSADDFQNRFPERVIIENITEDIFVTGDSFLFSVAVNNLLENAIKYSAKDKPVTVALSMRGTNALLEISDEGSGIDDDEKKKVFKKFYRTGNEATKRAKGTGLGLFLISRISKAHDGNITIHDNPKGGSIFALTLPANS